MFKFVSIDPLLQSQEEEFKFRIISGLNSSEVGLLLEGLKEKEYIKEILDDDFFDSPEWEECDNDDEDILEKSWTQK